MSRIATLRKSPIQDALQRGREAFRRQAWAEAVSELLAADRAVPLAAEDLLTLAQALLLTGKDREGADTLSRAHQAFLTRGDTRPAARCAFWLGFTALLNGDAAQSNGWLSRAERMLEDHPDCVEKGYLFLPLSYRLVHAGEGAKAYEILEKAVAIGRKFADPDLLSFAVQGQGRALIRQGEISRGVALLDEAMVAVMAGEVSPLTAGGVYCSVIEACGEIFDLRRAQEWTAALDRWCSSQPDLVSYRGQCLIKRAEILQLHGAWQEAFQQATQACQRLSEPPPKSAIGAAFYRLAEIHRLRGEFAAAEDAYREAGRWQKVPQPGMALLRLAQGQIESASAAIRRVADEVREPSSRARVLDAYVEIMIAAKDIPPARTAADELQKMATQFGAPLLHAASDRAQGSVLLAEGDAKSALAALRRSWAAWCELDAPYEAARTRVLMAQACGALEDCDAASLELDLAREVFQRLGASCDLARADAMLAEKAKGEAGPLTGRELEVLRLIAAGKSNRAIAQTLTISEKTVARHVSNIFNKLDLSSRAAATAYAYQNKLV
jgi:DNA-binding NarL/FixJ family response regulator